MSIVVHRAFTLRGAGEYSISTQHRPHGYADVPVFLSIARCSRVERSKETTHAACERLVEGTDGQRQSVIIIDPVSIARRDRRGKALFFGVFRPS
jgi:hypothetical protein